MRLSLGMGIGRNRGLSLFDQALSKLTLSGTEQVGAIIVDPGGGLLSMPVVFSASLTGLDGSSGGQIAHFGGNAVGSYVGFRANGSFIARAGGAGNTPNGTSTYPSTAYVLNSISPPSGSGKLVVEINPTSVLNIRVWWNGEQITGGFSSTSSQNMWAGTDDGAYLNGTSTDIPVGEVSALVTYATATEMSVYFGQTLDI